MRTLEDGAVIRQAKANDPRVTRVGAWLRRWSIDELPQLFNVIKGDMSLVGPRPHALSHDRQYERRIALYARRHNVKPGITGWAQIHGYRGETDTDEKMQRRVDHDLYYIDNWSLVLDLQILDSHGAFPRFLPKRVLSGGACEVTLDRSVRFMHRAALRLGIDKRRLSNWGAVPIWYAGQRKRRTNAGANGLEQRVESRFAPGGDAGVIARDGP